MFKKLGAVLAAITFCLLFNVQIALAAPYQLGQSNIYLLRHNIEVSNNNFAFARSINVRVPLMNESQPVYQHFLGERFSLQPLLIYKDADDNRYALFNIRELGPYESLIITVDYYVSNTTVSYNIDAQDYNFTDISGIDRKYISAEPGVEVTHQDIKNYAAKFLPSSSNFYSLAKKSFADVNLYMTYGARDDNDSGAVAAMHTAVGQCCDYASLYVAVMRAMGIPTRFQTGYCYEPAKHIVEPYVNTVGGYINLFELAHTWTEFYLPQAGWIFADPTFTYTTVLFGRDVKLVDWDHFAKIPSSRRYFYFRSNVCIPDISYEFAGAAPTLRFDARLYLNASYNPFSDTRGHWAEDEIMYLYNHKLMGGVAEDSFAPARQMTRAEMAVLLYRIAGLEYSGGSSYYDVPSGAWYEYTLASVRESGLMYGKGNNLFYPEEKLTRAELVMVMCRYLGIDEKDSTSVFDDVDPEHWAAAAIHSLQKRGLVRGISADSFEPESVVTRAEAAAIISRVLQYK